jgi:hypothetical protein
MGPAEADPAEPLNVKALYRKTRDRYDIKWYVQQILKCGLKCREIAAAAWRAQSPFARVGSGNCSQLVTSDVMRIVRQILGFHAVERKEW